MDAYASQPSPSHILSQRALVPGWNTTPFPHLAITAGGLIALADLRTVAHRTAIKGGSSWIDALVLAPGLQYQQTCDYLDRETPGGLFATPVLAASAGEQKRYEIRNSVMANYLAKLARRRVKGPFVLDIGAFQGDWDMKKQLSRMLRRGKKMVDEGAEVGMHTLDWLSHFFFILSPLYTLLAMYFMVLFEDVWGLCIIVALIVSRLLNVWAIKNRTQRSKPDDPSDADAAIREYTIDLGGGATVHIRGIDADLQALTSGTWLRAQSVLDGYLEAMAKMIVYLTASLSGNMTQAGVITLMALLLLSVMSLALSNAHAKGIRVSGRYAMLEADRWGQQRKGEAARHRV